MLERERLEREVHQLRQIIATVLTLWFPSPRPPRTEPDCESK
jgi:hypothetical protein